MEQHGIVEHAHDGRVEFSLHQPGGRTASPTETVVFAPGATDYDADRSIITPAAALPEIAERLLHKAHIAQCVIIPVGRWRPILDLLAFELATNEDWLDIDADATLHQNTRDPLGLTSKSRHVVALIAASLFPAADPALDLTIASLDSPFVLELRSEPALILHGPQAMAENLAASISG